MQQAIALATLRHQFNRAANTYDDAAVLQATVGQRLFERLHWLKLSPTAVLDIGAGTGKLTLNLAQHYRTAQVHGVDISDEMLKRALKRNPWFFGASAAYTCAQTEHLPYAAATFDLIFSNLTFQWVPLKQTLAECIRVLKPGGCLMFTTLGPDSLKELQAAWQAVDTQHDHVNQFLDMHIIGDALTQHFAEPVVDMEMITLTYNNVHALLSDLKKTGTTYADSTRRATLTGKSRLKAMQQAYEHYRNAEKRLPLTYEIIYGHAYKPLTAKQVAAPDGSIHVPIEQLKR